MYNQVNSGPKWATSTLQKSSKEITPKNYIKFTRKYDDESLSIILMKEVSR